MRHTTRRLAATILLLPVLLAGCGAISALSDASEPLDIYMLRAPDVRQVGQGAAGAELVVEEPIASGALATERIMIQPTPLQAQYLPGARWADTAPVMLQTLLVRSLMETRAFNSVGRAPIGAMADYALLSELFDFQAELGEGGGATVRLRMLVRLVRESDARVVATRTFTVTEAAAATDTASLVAAFDRGAIRLVSDLVPWLVASIGTTG